MGDVIVDVATVLTNANIGTVAAATGWGIFYGHEPDSPDTSITLYHYGGRDPHPSWSLDDVDIQIRIRGGKQLYAAAQAKAQDVKDALLGAPQQTINTIKYIGFWMTNDIIFLQYDDNGRPVFVTNWRIVREPPSSGSTLTHRQDL